MNIVLEELIKAGWTVDKDTTLTVGDAVDRLASIERCPTCGAEPASVHLTTLMAPPPRPHVLEAMVLQPPPHIRWCVELPCGHEVEPEPSEASFWLTAVGDAFAMTWKRPEPATP